ncbi:MAG TPA: hypothetical protein VIH18_12375 [Candidatus Binatia bacterium]|jgi:hypothetical protein
MKRNRLLLIILLTAVLAGAHDGVMAVAPEETDPEIKSLRERSRARIAFAAGRDFIEVFIHADDEKMETLRTDSCGGISGSKRYTGNYQIVSLKNKAFNAELPLGKRVFTQNRGEEIREIRFPEITGRLIAISQYQNCNGDEVEFFRVDSRGGLHQVRLHHKDGVERLRLVSRPGGTPDDLSGNQLTYCSSGKTKTAASCAVYIYDGKSLIQSAPAARKAQEKK